MAKKTDPETVEDAEIVPEPETQDPAPEPEPAYHYAGGGGGGEWVNNPQDAPAVEDTPEPERIHAYDAGEFHPELSKLMGNARDFMLDRIRNNWKPWQQMTVQEQQDLANAVEQQARDMIRGTVRAVNDYEWPHCMVTVGQVTLKGAEKGIEAKITAPMVTENLDFLGQCVEKRVMLLATNAEIFFGADRVKFDGRGSQMDLPLGGSAKDVETGGFEDEQAAIQDPAPTEEGAGDEDGQGAPVLTDGDAPTGDEGWDSGPWPDDEQLGERDEDAPPVKDVTDDAGEP